MAHITFTTEKNKYAITVNGTQYMTSNHGLIGDELEKAIKTAIGYKPENVVVSKPGRPDAKINRKWHEVKQGAGELSGADKKPLKGCSRILFVPVVKVNEVAENTFTIDAHEQEGFIVDKCAFLDAMDAIGAIRKDKVGSDGIRRMALQTFWIVSSEKKNGRLLDKMLDALYALCDAGDAITVQDAINL